MIPRRPGLLLGAALLAPAALHAQQAAPDKSESQIVVTGQPLDETAKALADCLARKCPPAQDIKASLRHAENLFLHGDYDAALGTLRQSGGRNRQYRKDAAPEFADLMRATALVSRHVGEDELYRTSTLSAQEVLADTLPPNDPTALIARLETGDMFGHLGKPLVAENSYRGVLDRARDSGRADIAASARLRLINLYLMIALRPSARDTYLHKARAMLGEMTADRDPQAQRFLLAGKLMMARIAAQNGDETELNAALAYYKAHATTLNPVLISSKAVDLGERFLGDGLFVNGADRYSPQLMDGQWLDVAFWVKPDGHVDDVEIIRKGKKLTGPWSAAVLKSLQARRYAPLALPPLDPGVLRIERYTYTAPFEQATASAIRRRAPHGRVEVVDLSNDAGAPPPSS
jgi:hypothetical protein